VQELMVKLNKVKVSQKYNLVLANFIIIRNYHKGGSDYFDFGEIVFFLGGMNNGLKSVENIGFSSYMETKIQIREIPYLWNLYNLFIGANKNSYID
jgi:hypothetical protein